MRNIKLVLEFDGTFYAGWQKQINGISVQQKITEAIYMVTGEQCKVTGCSRTDAGVHAKRYVCNFLTESTIPADKFKYAINNVLPRDIVVLDSMEAELEFHSRFNAKAKRYVYTICNREIPLAIGRSYMCHFKKSLDVDKMVKASEFFFGTHDFSAFKNTNSNVSSNTRTIHNISIVKENDIIKISVTGDGFLYNMVRIITGTLMDVGIGKIQPRGIKEIIESKDRNKAGKTAPPSGLYLEEVFY